MASRWLGTIFVYYHVLRLFADEMYSNCSLEQFMYKLRTIHKNPSSICRYVLVYLMRLCIILIIYNLYIIWICIPSPTWIFFTECSWIFPISYHSWIVLNIIVVFLTDKYSQFCSVTSCKESDTFEAVRGLKYGGLQRREKGLQSGLKQG